MYCITWMTSDIGSMNLLRISKLPFKKCLALQREPCSSNSLKGEAEEEEDTFGKKSL